MFYGRKILRLGVENRTVLPQTVRDSKHPQTVRDPKHPQTWLRSIPASSEEWDVEFGMSK